MKPLFAAAVLLLVVVCPIAGQLRAVVPSTKPTTAAWIKVSEDQDWYKSFKADEKVFTGRFAGYPAANPAAFMRPAFYYLDQNPGQITVYATQHNALLDDLTGNKVEIRGKIYEAEIEGHAVKEIWPGAIRQVD